MMAEQPDSTHSKVDLSQNEFSRIAKALKDEEFVKLLADYAKEIKDPENKKRYEAEIAAMEAERGCAVTFINPSPGYVIKTRNLAEGSKVFINICSDSHVGKPTSQADEVAGSPGLAWSIPYSSSRPRQDTDRGGETCSVYDLVFHPDTLYLAGRDQRMKGLVHNTALDALESTFQVKCDRSNLKFPRMKFKGVFRPTLIRRPLDGSDPAVLLPHAAPTMAEVAPELVPAAITPEYSIKYRSSADMQDHVIQRQDAVISSRPKELVVQVELPLLDSAAGVDLDVQEQTMVLAREAQPAYSLSIQLPFPVEEEKGSARFDKSRKMLLVSLPVRAAPQLKAERLSSNDSGIDVDPGYRIESEGACEGYRTTQSVTEEETQVEPGTEVQVVGHGFLQEGVPYTLPTCTISVQPDVIILTLEVKNVSPGSFKKQVEPNTMAVAFKFSSIGSGFVEIHHAFAIDFLIAGSMEEDNVEVEFWDNNVIVSLPLPAGVLAYRTGLSIQDLKDPVSLELARMEVEAGNRKKKGSKYKHEKHPKVMQPEEQEAEQLNSSFLVRRERHSSGDSLDSCMSESPMESVILKLQKDDDEASEKTEESCDEELQLESPRYLRANSEDSTQCQPRGILKRKVSGLVGSSRFRCYSESNLDEVGWSSGGHATSALSKTTIAEDEVAEFNGSMKKSVRFNEKVQQQLYR
jgi:dynein assembly factor 2